MFKVRHSSATVLLLELARKLNFQTAKVAVIINRGTKLTDRNESECLPIWKRFNRSQLINEFCLDRVAIQSES